MKFEIKCRFTAKVLFECEADSLKAAVEKAVEIKANLDGANLTGASLYGARLYGARLDGANLTGANLTGASLYGASLYGARLYGARLDGASLDGANLDGASLYGANLTGARLDGANLDGANLYGARLDGARLDGANLNEIKKDFLRIISAMKTEVVGLYKALLDGKIDGSKYEGECACLKGTLSNVRGCSVDSLSEFGIEKNSDELSENWFMAMHPGDTPENNQVSAITVKWLKEWAQDNGVKLPERVVIWKDASPASDRK